MEPVTGAAVAKAIATGGAEGAKETGRLISRVLGPAADEIGEALARYTAYRVGNVQRITENAASKGAGSGHGSVPPRVAHSILEEGSYSDDELSVEYLGGVLAAASTPGGRDDRAIVWSSQISRLSSLQIRAHFLIYREVSARVAGRTDLNLGIDTTRNSAKIVFELVEFLQALTAGHNVEPTEALSHAITGLIRNGLLDDVYAYGSKENLGENGKDSPYDLLLTVIPSLAGIELYGWAQGVAGMTPARFVEGSIPFAEDDVPRLQHVAMPKLTSRPGEASAQSDDADRA